MPVRYFNAMSYNIALACDPKTGLSHTRILEAKGPSCPATRHEIGFRLFLWEILPDPAYQPRPVFVSDGSRISPI
jgi:hypothetical protein